MLTDEQKAIIDSDEDRMMVKAVAGSRKTATILKKVESIDENITILYLAFNKSIEREIQPIAAKRKNFLPKMFHALAYRYVGYKYRNKLVDTYRVNDVITDLGLRRNELNIIYATTLLNVFNFYLHSEYMRIDDMPLSTLFESWSHFGKDMPADLNRLFKLQKMLITKSVYPRFVYETISIK